MACEECGGGIGAGSVGVRRATQDGIGTEGSESKPTASGLDQDLQSLAALSSDLAQCLQAVQPWVTHFTSLSLRFLFCL